MSSRALAGDDFDCSVKDDGASQQVMTNDKSSTTEAVGLGGAQITVPIASDLDIVAARERGRVLAVELGYPAIQATLIATAISELARNIALYAAQGEIVLTTAIDGNRIGIIVTARDQGPGIKDVARAIAGEPSTSAGLRLGLAGVRRLMDAFEISSQAGQGTMVTVTSWKR
jgi:serine/threonine-protein kinase RsbT